MDNGRTEKHFCEKGMDKGYLCGALSDIAPYSYMYMISQTKLLCT